MRYPEYVEIDKKKYKINTDFRIAIKCDEIAKDENINEYEKPLAIIYKLFGNEGLRDIKNHEKLMELAQKYLLCGEEHIDNKKPDMDFVKDMDYIEASFMSDYHIDLTNVKMHWWKFYNLINGLSNSELGNCCILNKIRNGRTYDASKISDRKERDEFIEWQKSISLDKNERKPIATEKQRESARKIYEKLGL